MEIEVNDDKTVSLSIDGTFTADALTHLLHEIGDARASIAEDPDVPPPNNHHTQIDPRFIVSKLDVGGSLLVLRLDRYGWITVAIAPESRQILIDLLQSDADPNSPVTSYIAGGSIN